MTIEELKAHQKKSAEATVSANEKKEKQKDPRFFEITFTDKDHKISRTILRPLSCVADEDQNVVVQTTHFIKKNNRNYSCICPKTGGKGAKCPICERYWSKPYGERDANLKPKKKWLMNVYVIEDTGNPENNGKTFIWACPKTVWDKIEAARTAQYEDERVENIFDLWEGANLVIRTKDKGGFVNYDDSVVKASSALFPDLADNDPKYLKVAESAYPLKEFQHPAEMKSYSELAEMLNEIDGLIDDNVNTNPTNYVRKNNLEDDLKEQVNDEIPEVFNKEVEETTEDDFFKDEEENPFVDID